VPGHCYPPDIPQLKIYLTALNKHCISNMNVFSISLLRELASLNLRKFRAVAVGSNT
jgi:hypothetical protein